MPNPVAEVVERLREAAREIRHDGTPSQVGLTEDECLAFADLLERLSRERDTGVPEGWRDISAAPRNGTQILVRTKDGSVNIAWWSSSHQAWAYGGGLWGENVVEWFPVPGSSAAPQPTTVSTQGWQDIRTAPKDGSQILARTKDGSIHLVWWSDIRQAWAYGGGSWAANVVEWAMLPDTRADLPDLSTLTRERDQAREALAVCVDSLEVIALEPVNKNDGVDHEKHARVLASYTLKRVRSVQPEVTHDT